MVRDLGVAVELPAHECSVAGTKQIVWQTTDGLPVAPVLDEREVLMKAARAWLKTASDDDLRGLLGLPLATVDVQRTLPGFE